MMGYEIFKLTVCWLALLGIDHQLSAQHEPAVRLMMKLYCAENNCRVQPMAFGNGVIIGRNHERLLIVTVAHNLRQVQEVHVSVAGRWYRAGTVESNDQLDLGLLEVAGEFAVPVAEVAAVDPPEGARVLIDTYWPTNWERRVISTERLPRRFERFQTLNTVVRPGVSGAGVVYAGKLAGLVHGVTVAAPVITLYVPGSTIYQQLCEWGYLPPENISASQDRNLREIAGSTPGLMNAQWLERQHKHQQELTDLKRQIESLSAEVRELAPLKNRQLILMNEGRVSSQKSLRPADPIVLGSEIVIRKGQDASR